MRSDITITIDRQRGPGRKGIMPRLRRQVQ